MATKLEKNVSREAHSPAWGDLIVTLAPEGVYVREKGRRKSYGPVTFGVIYQIGARMEAEANSKPRKARFSRNLIGR